MMKTPKKGSFVGLTTLLSVLAVLGLGVGVYFNFAAESKKKVSAQLGVQYLKAQQRLSRLTQQNNQVIYMPNAHDLYLSAETSDSVNALNKLFTDATNYGGTLQYQMAYQHVQKQIHDKRFYRQFMRTPHQVSVMQLYLSNVRTQVLVLGNNTYEVLVSYIPYHSSSDLYQSNNLQVLTRAFIVKGHRNAFTTARLDPQLITQGPVVYAGQLN